MSEAKAPVSLTLTIDKSVSKIAAWVLVYLVVSSIVIGIGVVMAVNMTIEWRESATETRLLEQQIMDMNALMVREGLRQPSDHSNGPAGNIQYERKQ